MELWMLAFLQIMLINIILSGDNAIVIALASRNLPVSKRKLAIFWGAFGAIALRVLLTAVAIKLLQIPYLMAVGSLLLLWVALKLVIDNSNHQKISASQQLGMVVMTIVMADFIMSLDNVIAIAAVAHGDMFLIIFGISLSIPLIIWGSNLILWWLDTYPILIYIGAGVLGLTAGEMLLNEQKLAPFIENSLLIPHWLIACTIGLLVIVCGWLCNRILNIQS